MKDTMGSGGDRAIGPTFGPVEVHLGDLEPPPQGWISHRMIYVPLIFSLDLCPELFPIPLYLGGHERDSLRSSGTRPEPDVSNVLGCVC
jgi:hypothetical protein